MTHKENITAILECYFTGFKKEIIDSACNRILEQERYEDTISRQIVISLPPVTPKEKTAAWVPVDAEPRDIYECNACGWLLYYEDRTDFKYCPNCGARMIEPQESEVQK